MLLTIIKLSFKRSHQTAMLGLQTDIYHLALPYQLSHHVVTVMTEMSNIMASQIHDAIFCLLYRMEHTRKELLSVPHKNTHMT